MLFNAVMCSKILFKTFNEISRVKFVKILLSQLTKSDY